MFDHTNKELPKLTRALIQGNLTYTMLVFHVLGFIPIMCIIFLNFYHDIQSSLLIGNIVFIILSIASAYMITITRAIRKTVNNIPDKWIYDKLNEYTKKYDDKSKKSWGSFCTTEYLRYLRSIDQ